MKNYYIYFIEFEDYQPLYELNRKFPLCLFREVEIDKFGAEMFISCNCQGVTRIPSESSLDPSLKE